MSIKLSGEGLISQEVSLQENTEYILSAWIKTSPESQGIIVIDTQDVFDNPGQGQFVQYDSEQIGDWIYYNGSFNSGSVTQLTIRCFGESFSGNAWIDGLILKVKE